MPIRVRGGILSIPCECCLVSPQHTAQILAKVIARCPLTVSLAQVEHENDITTSREVYTKLHSERGLFHTRPVVY